MKKKGQLGQIITSFPVLILVFLIMIIFVIISGFISIIAGADETQSKDRIESINSRVLLEMFLGDYVLIDRQKEKVEDVILEVILANENHIQEITEKVNKKELIELIQKRFHEKYSCYENNQLQFYAQRRENPTGFQDKTAYHLYIDYPNTLKELSKEKIYSESAKTDAPVPESILVGGIAEQRLSEGFNWFAVAKGNVRC